MADFISTTPSTDSDDFEHVTVCSAGTLTDMAWSTYSDHARSDGFQEDDITSFTVEGRPGTPVVDANSWNVFNRPNMKMARLLDEIYMENNYEEIVHGISFVHMLTLLRQVKNDVGINEVNAFNALVRESSSLLIKENLARILNEYSQSKSNEYRRETGSLKHRFGCNQCHYGGRCARMCYDKEFGDVAGLYSTLLNHEGRAGTLQGNLHNLFASYEFGLSLRKTMAQMEAQRSSPYSNFIQHAVSLLIESNSNLEAFARPDTTEDCIYTILASQHDGAMISPSIRTREQASKQFQPRINKAKAVVALVDYFGRGAFLLLATQQKLSEDLLAIKQLDTFLERLFTDKPVGGVLSIHGELDGVVDAMIKGLPLS